ncbi:tRNA 2-selenouridine(34) synthase MnmH [Parashewanella curva]|uniref:tRNA 2-selenouridine synthase n=1 Tax=Parashewanella curva TaxID=2338552 RepID=A0A3L8PSC1_9GAMM|nr:tRNA 2-selenouridine(34) synthase MnmH [Parashewanella curva]RLV58291.1 tRNA 2-selenouridine(34) synthase MnmH [Parashewanella curva]
MVANIVPKTEYQNTFLEDRPLMDVRAPVEFQKGAFPHATSLPLMMDDERAKVGTCYKQHGQQAAIELGHQLVSGKVKQQRIEAWAEYIQQNPDAYFYCFRGGLRSQVTLQWLNEASVDVPYIEGGYKAMRQFLIEMIEQASKRPMLILSGSTGCGKTEFLSHRTEAIDLEGLANHRGSSFGRNITHQPTQINFENALAVKLLKHQAKDFPFLLLEDESHLIGRSSIPRNFYLAMQQAPIIVLEDSHEQRLQRLLNEYVIDMHAGFVDHLGLESGTAAFEDYLLTSIDKIKKRLGGKSHANIVKLIINALNAQQNQNTMSEHLAWINVLLTQYYDPMYEYQLSKKANRILLKGSKKSLSEWIVKKR